MNENVIDSVDLFFLFFVFLLACCRPTGRGGCKTGVSDFGNPGKDDHIREIGSQRKTIGHEIDEIS